MFRSVALPRAIGVQFGPEMDRSDLDLLEASIGRSDPAGSAQVRSGSRVPTSSPSSPVCSGSANRSPPRSDRPLRRRSRLSVSDEELDFRAPGYAQVPPAASGDDDDASFMGNLSEASGSAHLSLRGSANLERSECGGSPGGSDDELDDSTNHHASSDSDDNDDDGNGFVGAWSWLEAEDEFPGIIQMGLTDDDPEVKDALDWDESPSSDGSDNEWQEGDEAYEAPAPAAGLSRRDRIRGGHDPEKSSLWTARNKNKMAEGALIA